jgi:hypothetical protein
MLGNDEAETTLRTRGDDDANIEKGGAQPFSLTRD